MNKTLIGIAAFAVLAASHPAGVEFTSAFGRVAEAHGRRASAAFDANDPQETLDVHCGNGFDAGFSPYQSARLKRYNAGPELRRA
jgi:hypothetical protein